MSLADHTLFYKPKPDIHVIVTYSDRDKLNNLVANFLNEGLKRNQLCVYCSVDLPAGKKEMASKVLDFEESILKGNLLMIDLKPYIETIIDNDMGRLEILKKLVSMQVKKRADKHVRLYGELAGHLFENEHFEQCISLEKWWQKNPLGGTTICPYKSPALDQMQFSEQRDEVVHNHDKVMLC